MKYNVILCDPPWSYRNKRTGGSMKSGSVNKFPVLTLDEIKALPITRIVDRDCVLYLWATVPLLPDALEVMKTWGFTYKTSLFWRKIMSLGMGYWYRGQVEILLFGIHGKVKAFRMQVPNIIQTKVGAYSEKPAEFRKLIEESTQKMLPCNKIELFATKRVENWNAIGYDIDGKDIREILNGNTKTR